MEVLLADGGTRYHSITSRAKGVESFSGKLSKPESSYSQLTDVTDLAALRITTYFNSDVDVVAELIEREFEVIREHSHDRREAQDPDRFGYVSVHYVVALSAPRVNLGEYRRFLGKRIEIQIRSVLQHAWAEIEHDLGYKSKGGIPREMRRRFARLAGMLEIADDEFAALRQALESYRSSLGERVVKEPDSVEINKDSLALFVYQEPATRIDRVICRNVDADLEDRPGLELLLQRVEKAGMKTLAELKSALENYEAETIELATRILGPSRFVRITGSQTGSKPDRKRVAHGTSIFYLCYVVMARKGLDAFIEYLKENKLELGDNPLTNPFVRHALEVTQRRA